MANKLGFYLHNFEIGEHKGDLFRAIQEVRPPTMLVHAWDQVDQLRHLSPDSFIIGRMDYFGQDRRPIKDLVTPWLDSDNPEARGREFAEHILNDNFQMAQRREGGRLLIDAWMSLNEAVPGPASEAFQKEPEKIGKRLSAYDDLQVGFRDKLMEKGVEAVAFNFGAGNFGTANHYWQFFKRTLASYTYLGFHEYGWPALSAEVNSSAVSTGGTYRPIVTGISQMTGRRYQVILTEAGLTFMHKYPKSGFDKGWLFVPPPDSEYKAQPLSQDDYWRSLAWLNTYMGQDPFVLGACLFEVGHHGDWETFRHFGSDNAGQSIWIMNSIQQLAAAGREIEPREVAPRGARLAPIALRGDVVGSDGQPVLGAAIRVIGGADTLGADPHAAANSRGAVTWTRPLTGYAGGLWNCWQKYIAPNVAGITWEEFRREAAQYNPSLRDTDNRMVAEATYYLPENRVFADTRGSPPAIVWDRLLDGFEGDLRTCWRHYVQGKVVGLTWQQFKAEAGSHNPGLASTDGRFRANEVYVLPRNVGHDEYVRMAFSLAGGRFAFDELPPGTYRLEVSASGYRRLVRTTTVAGDETITITLEPILIVVEKDDPFVRVTPPHFTIGGCKFRFIGVNLRGLAHYGLSEPVKGANAEQQLREARTMGARVVRMFLPHCRISAEDTRGRLVGLLKLMEEKFNDMYLIVALANLYSDVDFHVPGDDAFYVHQPAGEDRKLLSLDWFREGYKDNYLSFVQTILKDDYVRNSPRIMAYDIGNELKAEMRDGNNNVGHPEVLVDFMHAMAKQMRKWDGGKHLITTGMISTRHVYMGANDCLRVRLYDIPQLDFITNHAYHGDDDPQTNLDQENEAPSREDDSDLAVRLGKPLLIEEAGIKPTESRKDRSQWVAKELQTLLVEHQVAGYMPWGFMPGSDNGDGDRDVGMDWIWHGDDWGSLYGILQQRAAELAADSAEITPPSSVFSVNQQIFTQTTVNLRSDAGMQAAVIQQVPGRTRVMVTGTSRERDALVWWPVRVTLPAGTFEGWMAQTHHSGAVLLSAV